MAMSYKTPEAVKYQKGFIEYVKQEVENQGYVMPESKTQHYYIDAVFYFDRTDRDPNNYFKCMFDAITDTGMVWPDDNVTCERVQHIYYDHDDPRIELTIYPTDYIGVFDNASQLDEFESNCIDCVRYKRNCSILQKAKHGYIQEEIKDCVCSKYKKRKDENIKEKKDNGK